MRKYFFNENYQKDLMQKGYTIIPMFSDEEIVNLISEMNKLQSDDDFAPKEKDTFNNTLENTDADYRRNTYNLIYKFFSHHIDRILLNCEILTFGFLDKPPGAGKGPIHQDWTFTYDTDDVNLTFWCPLVDADESNGTMFFVEGSHRIIPNIVCPQTSPYYMHFEESLKKFAKPIPVNAGQALVFDSSIIHWSTQNNSDKPRIVAGLSTVPREAKSVFYFPDRDTPDKRFEVFEISKDFFIDHSIQDITNGNFQTKSVGFIENKNRVISKEEFMELLERGDEIRHRIYFPENEIETYKKFSLLNRLKPLLKTNI